MRALRRPLAPLLSATVLLASALPCPPEEPVPASGHETARWELGNTQDAAPPLALNQRCRCSCHEKGSSASAGGHLGFAVTRVEEPEPAWNRLPLSTGPPRAGSAPQLGVARVPV